LPSIPFFLSVEREPGKERRSREPSTIRERMDSRTGESYFRGYTEKYGVQLPSSSIRAFMIQFNNAQKLNC
jgi:hypothetical protein